LLIYLKDFLKQNIPENTPEIMAIHIIIPPNTEDLEIDGINNTGDVIKIKTILAAMTEITIEIDPINIFINLSLFVFIMTILRLHVLHGNY
jgi:hypothetical protein